MEQNISEKYIFQNIMPDLQFYQKIKRMCIECYCHQMICLGYLLFNQRENILDRSSDGNSKALTVQYKNTRYQLLVNGGYRYTLINAKILIEEGKLENVTLRYKDKVIPYETIQSEILKVKPYQVVSAKEFQERRVNIPRIDHPWRTRFLPAV